MHAGSLVAALASWLDVRARDPAARWLVRIEDADTERCLPGMGKLMLRQLANCGLISDTPPWWQSQRGATYAQALAQLQRAGMAYPCACSRKDIDDALTRQGVLHHRHGERVYPGTCRAGLQNRPVRAWRFATNKTSAATRLCWTDRRLGWQCQDVRAEVGDFILKRADGPWAYQLAVVLDDAEQGVTDIVRGEDLADNTARQILLQQALGLATPSYLHTPLVLAVDGEKLSKQNGAAPLDTSTPAATLAALEAAASVLNLPAANASTTTDALALWVLAWRALYNPAP